MTSKSASNRGTMNQSKQTNEELEQWFDDLLANIESEPNPKVELSEEATRELDEVAKALGEIFGSDRENDTNGPAERS